MRYDFRCSVCGHEEERDVPVAERDAQPCPVCPSLMARLPHFAEVGITVPETFHLNARYYTDPDRLPGVREAWDEETGTAHPGRRYY